MVRDLMEVIDNLARDSRSRYHVTLGTMVELLKKIPPTTSCYFCNPHSYRGYYEDLGLEKSPEPRPASVVLEELEGCIGATFSGWKGGAFTMKGDTPLWLVEVDGEGRTGEAILFAETLRGRVVLSTKKVI